MWHPVFMFSTYRFANHDLTPVHGDECDILFLACLVREAAVLDRRPHSRHEGNLEINTPCTGMPLYRKEGLKSMHAPVFTTSLARTIHSTTILAHHGNSIHGDILITLSVMYCSNEEDDRVSDDIEFPRSQSSPDADHEETSHEHRRLDNLSVFTVYGLCHADTHPSLSASRYIQTQTSTTMQETSLLSLHTSIHCNLSLEFYHPYINSPYNMEYISEGFEMIAVSVNELEDKHIILVLQLKLIPDFLDLAPHRSKSNLLWLEHSNEN
ncbi:hypothetical protein Hypma_005621 [Hypsizygus marmoreus]|uniref:Uncharacterized protein n=1 Tax=Hypsizygus marmoreus TaxID=39966 RepID=A0A369JYT4_HYPMA|nr:hypothetical protein Hypma_005621 [Hypsizygus marmoreus]